MTSLFFRVPAKDSFASKLCESIARHLPQNCVLLSYEVADITLTHDGSLPHNASRHWSLVWADGTPLASTGSLALAACRAHAVAEILLTEHADEQWHIIGRAAFKIEPGQWNNTLATACERAAQLLNTALRNKNPVREPYISGEHYSLNHRMPFAFGLRLLWRRLADKFYRIAFYENWMIGIVNAPITESIDWRVCPETQWLNPGSDKYYLADPFCWPGDTSVVLCEEYDFAASLGHIVRLSISGNRIESKMPVAFPLPGHMSFPFLFEHEGDVYCLPESGAARRLILFKWEKNDFREYATPLQEVEAADSVLFRHEGLFWIAYTDVGIGTSDNLNLIYAGSLKGPWQAHIANPIKLDPRYSRGAGPLFSKDDVLYRPAQDCSKSYGGSLCIMRITECTPERFTEELVTAIMPGPGLNPHGLHTLAPFGSQTLIDGKHMVFSLPLVFKKAWKRLRAKILPYSFLYTRDGM